MLKLIEVEKLRLGMHIHKLCGPWMDHPFWRNAFLLDDPKDMHAVLSSGLREVWIDTSKGLDVHCSNDELPTAEVASTPTIPVQAATASAVVPRADVAQEAARAIKICANAKQAITSMFEEARMGQALNGNDALVVVEEISSSVLRNPNALISLARLKNKDDYTYMHSVAVCALMVSLGRQLGLDAEQVRQAGLAGLVHDIGKVMIPEEILNKPGKLTDTEFTCVKAHPDEGHKLLLKGSDFCAVALDVCLHHHERIDGSGYPERLTGDQISLYAKMGAVCDVYDAISSDRPYKNGWEPAESLRRMAEWRIAGHFDKLVFEAFVKSIGIYPVGSLVRLESNHLGVVIGQSEQSLLVPRVKLFFSIKSNGRIPTEIIDLSKPHCRDKIISHESPEKWGIADLRELWSGVAT